MRSLWRDLDPGPDEPITTYVGLVWLAYVIVAWVWQ